MQFELLHFLHENLLTSLFFFFPIIITRRKSLSDKGEPQKGEVIYRPESFKRKMLAHACRELSTSPTSRTEP